jgi:hypothetical protein
MTRAAGAQFADWFNLDWQSRRKVTVTVPENVPTDRLTGVATIMTFGSAKPDGSDLRIFLAGREIPCQILRVGPGDALTVAFSLIPNQNSYYFYFGNPQAPASSEKLDLKAGLLLEVRGLPGGECRTLAEARDMFGRARHIEGADFVPNVFYGYNPFGPPDNFIARYSGFLNITKDGSYTFATSSTYRSFLLVDGK